MVEIVGANTCHAGIEAADTTDPSEVILRMGVKGPDRDKVNRFGPELVPLVTSGPPGVTGFVSAEDERERRPKPVPPCRRQ